MNRIAPGAALISVLCASAAGAATVSFADVAYGPHERNKLDLYIADGSAAPLVVFLHGGAYMFGDKSSVDRFGVDQFLDSGYSVAAMNYQLAPASTFPAQREDLRNAFTFLKDNGETYGYDAGTMAAFGESAGATYAALAAFDMADEPELRLDAVVSWYIPYDFLTMQPDADALNHVHDHVGPGAPASQLIGAPVEDNPQLAYESSPPHFLDMVPEGTELPPFLIMHGLQDTLVPYTQSEQLYDELIANGGSPRVELQLLPEGTHAGGAFMEPAAIDTVTAFLDEELRVAPIPLPASLPLALLGMGALAGLRLRRRP